MSQSNKPFKSRHATSGQLKKQNKGRVSLKAGGASKGSQLSKQQRRLQSQQKTRNSRVVARAAQRGVYGLPKLITIVPLVSSAHPSDFTSVIEADQSGMLTGLFQPSAGTRYYRVNRFNTTLCFRHLEGRQDAEALVELSRTAEIVAFLMRPEVIDGQLVFADEEGERLISLLKAGGLPTVVGLISIPPDGEREVRAQQKHDRRKNRSGDWAASTMAACSKYLERHFGDQVHRVLDYTSQTHLEMAIRMFSESIPHCPAWRDRRCFLVPDSLSHDPSTGYLTLSAYTRGAPLSPDQVLMLPGLSRPCRVHEIAAYKHDPCHRSRAADATSDDVAYAASFTPDPDCLDPAIRPDPASAEDPCPPPPEEFTDDIMAQPAPSHFDQNYRVSNRRVPKGTSSYQAAWILDEHHLEGDSDPEIIVGDDAIKASRSKSHSKKTGKPSSSSLVDDSNEDDSNEDDSNEDDSNDSSDDGGFNPPSQISAFDISDDESEGGSEDEDDVVPKTLEELAAEDLEFPDEMDTPMDVAARERFVKYRGLRSMRSTPWDPRENLPLEYSRVFQFENFASTARYARNKMLALDAENPHVNRGRYIRLVLEDVPAEAVALWNGRPPAHVTALFPFENQPSLLHFAIRKSAYYEEVVKSKDELEFVVGFRSFVSRPIFSEFLPGASKYKMERFLHEGRDVVATVYAPIIFPPANVLVYSVGTGPRRLVASGQLLSVDPDRIILKKVVLSGHPFKVKGKKAVLRKMFFNPDDIRYFQSIELRTKYGRTGHIIEPLGIHGHMKCVFDAPLTQADTVLMNLYKRVFPPWELSSAFQHLHETDF